MCRTVKLFYTQPSAQVVESGYQTDPRAGVGCPYLTGDWKGGGTGRGRMEVLIEPLSMD